MASLGLTPKVAGIHWDDILRQFRVRVTFQLVTPFGTFPEREEVQFYGDLASVLNFIKTIWAITTTIDADDGSSIPFDQGDYSILATVPAGHVLTEKALMGMPAGHTDTEVEPDVVPDYDGVADSWGG